MGYPKGYSAVHINKDLQIELDELNDFGAHLGRQEKIKQLLRFYKAKKNRS